MVSIRERSSSEVPSQAFNSSLGGSGRSALFVIDYTSSKNESLRYHFGQFVPSVGKVCQRGTVGYGDGEGEKDGIAVVLPSFVAWIIRDSTAKKFTVPERKEVDVLQKVERLSGATACETG